ncbi:hypothetical protein H0Z11_04170 [Pantoea agglomerans]|uniref:hypothetical protein n=1 Tax=Enterobacter agglomerans TaxID=549 RepID=UPI001AA02582|nr:hypothetical protein [Pantoea agglomerans]QTC51082.1 hypothetical protein H0Z11_04170 [Pantoea agglomerans]
MKKKHVSAFIFFSIIIGFTPAALYLLNFNEKILPFNQLIKNISSDNQTWGNFGSFLSGTTGALFSFIGILAVIWTLFKTHESSERQIAMLSNEQTFNQFNTLLDILISILENKSYPSIHSSGKTGFREFKDDGYNIISLLLNDHTTSTGNEKKPKGYFNIATFSVFYDLFSNEYAPNIYSKESAIYTILLDRIMTAEKSTKEALIAILLAKLNEHYIFFLNCNQVRGKLDKRMERMVRSNIPLAIPLELMNLIDKY